MSDQRYQAVLADNPSALQIHHRIRHKVYCLERKFEDPAQHPAGEERDGWDAAATRFIVYDRESHHWVGAMRLVRPVEGVLPIDRLAGEPQGRAGSRSPNTLELSRICVLPEHRMAAARLGRARAGPRISPLCGSAVLATMLRGASEYARDHEANEFLVLITPAMARMIQRMGFLITRTGPAHQHKGARYPYRVDLEAAIRHAIARSPRMANLFLGAREPYVAHSSFELNGLRALDEVAA